MIKSKIFDPSYLEEILDWDKELGAVYWKERPREDFITKTKFDSWNRKFAGRRAGTLDLTTGRLKIHIFKKTYDLAKLLAIYQGWEDIYFKNGQTVDLHPDNLSPEKTGTVLQVFDNSFLQCGPGLNGGFVVKGGPKLFGIFRKKNEAYMEMLELADKLQCPFESTEELITW